MKNIMCTKPDLCQGQNGPCKNMNADGTQGWTLIYKLFYQKFKQKMMKKC